MHPPGPICLTFGEEVPASVRPRIEYAFRVFGAIYGHAVLKAEPNCTSKATRFVYGKNPAELNGARAVHIPWRYTPNSRSESSFKLVRHRYLDEDFLLSYGLDPHTGNPDFLGEIFEWLSSSYETRIVARDDVGRIPYSEMVFERQQISPHKPHALLLMAWMENVLRNVGPATSLPKAPSPIRGTDHTVICSHDVDFYHADRPTTLIRLLKNLGISCRPYRSFSYFRSNLAMMSALLDGKRVGDYLPHLLEAGKQQGFSSTVFVVPRRTHRRDPNYQLSGLRGRLAELSKNGFRVGLHGSYTSIVESEALASEAAAIEEATGRKAVGSRQHWLRFDRHEKLFSDRKSVV